LSKTDRNYEASFMSKEEGKMYIQKESQACQYMGKSNVMGFKTCSLKQISSQNDIK